MVSVKLVNKSEYEKTPTECLIRREGALLKPTPEFSITGLAAEKKYQIFLSFEQGQNVRKPTHQVELSFPAKPYTEKIENHPLGINFGSEFMKENIVFKKLRITNSREHDNTSTIHLNSCHRYTPVLTIVQFEKNESGEWEKCRVDPMKFKFEEGSFETVTNYSKPVEKIRKVAKSGSQGPIQDQQEACQGAHLPATALPSGYLKRTMERQEDTENRRKRPCQRSKEDAEFIATLVQRFSVPELQDILRIMRERESTLVQGQVQASEDEANVFSEAPSIEDQDQVPDVSIQLQESENQSEAEVVVHDDVLEVQVEAEVNAEVEDKDQTLNAADQPETEAPPVQPEPDAESTFPEIQTILRILGKPVTIQGQDQVQASEEEFAEASNERPMLQNPEDTLSLSSRAAPVSIKIELDDEPEASQDSNQEAYPGQSVLEVEAHSPDSSEAQSEDETPLDLQAALQAIDQPPLTGLALLAHLQAQHHLLAQQGAAHSQFHLFHQNNTIDPRFNNQLFQYHQPQSYHQAQFPPFIPNRMGSEPTQLMYVPMQVPVSHLNQNLMPTNQLFPPQVAYPPPPPPQTSPFYNVLPYNGAPF